MHPREASSLNVRSYVVVGLFALVLGVHPSGAAPASAITSHVHIKDFAYDPATIHILIGDTIEWDNHDSSTHTVTADDNSFDSGDMSTGETYTRTFPKAGRIPYHCARHASMTATIVVTDPSAVPDLVVSSVEASDVFVGVEKLIKVTVRNFGVSEADTSTTKVTFDYKGKTRLIREIDTPAVPAGATRTVETTWDIIGKLGDYPVTALADSANVVGEASEANNALTVVVSNVFQGMAPIDVLDP